MRSSPATRARRCTRWRAVPRAAATRASFTRDLEARARDLLVVQTLGEVPSELSLTPEIDERLHDQAQRVGRAEVVRVLDLLGAALRPRAPAPIRARSWSWRW